MTQTIAIAGATGFIGRALVRSLQQRSEPPRLIGLSRRAVSGNADGVEWRSCNLFNLLHTERALQGATIAIYLVHSMMPQAALTQGHFSDMDLICADNFARAARTVGIKHIVYLSGLIPEEKELSAHLRSRLEVEHALASHGVPVTTLRAGLILGPGGSSFNMMLLLVRRLRVMVTPSWTRSLTQPIALRDVTELLAYAIDHPEIAGECYDIGGPDVLTYAQLMGRLARLLGRSLRLVTVPIYSPKLSLLWVSLITQTPRQLVLPLVASLRHEMVAHDGLRLQKLAQVKGLSLEQALEAALHDETPPPLAMNRSKSPVARNVVSVQRLTLPDGTDAAWVAREYARWLPLFLRPWLRAQVEEASTYRFFLPLFRSPLLQLSFAPQRSNADRQLFYISGGSLARLPQQESGRFEFRAVLDRRFILTAIHDYVPRLPWYIYKATQAVAHQFVMYFFGRHLARLASQRDASKEERRVA